MIIGEQILHQMEHVFGKIVSIEMIQVYVDMVEEWVFSRVFEPLIEQVLGKIVGILLKFDFVKVVFMGSHLRLVDREKMVLYKKIVTEYNIQMRRLILKLKDGYQLGDDKLEFLSVIDKIGVENENGYPLTLDGTHLNWPRSRYNNESTVQVPAHLAIDNILVNYLCIKE